MKFVDDDDDDDDDDLLCLDHSQWSMCRSHLTLSNSV